MTRARTDCVAYHPATKPKGKAQRGRPKLYGKKVKLTNLFRSALAINTLISPVYDERNVKTVSSVHNPTVEAGRASGALRISGAPNVWALGINVH